jgi:hypothetical protein
VPLGIENLRFEPTLDDQRTGTGAESARRGHEVRDPGGVVTNVIGQADQP